MNDKRQALDGKNRRVGLAVFVTVAVMVGMSFAAVPLYRLFCSATGYNGTTQVAKALPPNVIDRVMTVRFDTGLGGGLNWRFTPEQRQVKVRMGERALAAFKAENLNKKSITGTALYNVTPLKVGKYFKKIECFCFQEQVLEGGKTATLPVVFYIDPAMDKDPDMADVHYITLSYTFFDRNGSALDKAMEDFYNQPADAPAALIPAGLPAGAQPGGEAKLNKAKRNNETRTQ